MREQVKRAENDMHRIIDFVKREFSALRASRANVSLLDGITVSAYGSQMPLNQVATLTTPQPSLIMVQPWDKSLAAEITKKILAANLGLNPISDATGVRVPVPPLSEERRREIVKVAHKIAEQGRVEIRDVRHKADAELKKSEKDKKISEDDMHHGIAEVQKLTDQTITDIDKLLSAKEKEILE